VLAAMLLAAVLLAAVLLASGCGRVIAGQPAASSQVTVDQSLIMDYFERSNAAALDGAAAQQRFLASTQHPDVDQGCDLGELTVLLEPALSTLRPDDGWRPTATDRAPRGRVYLVAVTVTVQRDQSTLGVQVGSMHLVVLDSTVYGFAPCPR
jgi:hypothetical protein